MSDPLSPELQALLEQADLAYNRARLEEARDLYARVLALNPGVAHAHSRMGAIQAQMGDLDGAEASLREALALEPDLASAISNLGNIYYSRGQYGEALQQYLLAAQKDPENPVFQQNLHAAYRKLGQLDKAVAALRQSRKLEQAAYRNEARVAFSRARSRMGCGGATALLLCLTGAAIWATW